MRAIFLTSVTTYAGLVPLIFETSEQAQFLIPAAIAMGYGILFATLITLILIPALTMIGEDLKPAAKRPSGETPPPSPPTSGTDFMTHPNIEILLVEDDIDLASSTADFLALEGITCDHAYNGQAGLKLATENSYQVLVLDLMLPRMDGITLCEKLRQQGTDTPVLMLTARDTLEDKIAGFRAGTDDYLVKPFAMEELAMRVRALAVRRSGQVRKLQVGALTLNLDSRHASRDGVTLKLTPSGWTLLETLMRASPNPSAVKTLNTASGRTARRIPTA